MMWRERIVRMAGPIAFAAALISAALIYPVLFLRHPPIWPDEGLFANPGIEWIRHGVLGTSLIGDLIDGMETRTYWVPPVYLVTIAAVFKAFGIGVVQMRLFSAVCGIASVLLVWLICRRLTDRPWLPWIAAALLLIDPIYIRAMTIGRMDIMAVVFGLGSIYACQRWRIMWISGLLAGLALTTHPMGGAAVAALFLTIVTDSSDTKRLRSFGHAAIGLGIALLPWLIYILQDPHSFLVQFWGQFIRKADRPNIGLGFLLVPFDQYGNESVRRLGLIAFAAALAGHLRAKGIASHLFWWGLCSFVLASLSREMWYGPYLTPCLVIGLPLAITAVRKYTKYAVILVLFIWAYYLGDNLKVTYQNYKITSASTDYQAFCDDISKHIPRNSSVILSAIPDPYLGLADRPDLKIYHFIPGGVPADPLKYQERLSIVDFYVITEQLSYTEVGQYARDNGDIFGVVGEPGNGYSAIIYERRGR